MKKWFIKFVKKRSKEIPPWASPPWLLVIGTGIVVLSWKFIRFAIFHLCDVPVISKLIFTPAGTIGVFLVTWTLIFFLFWKTALPCYCRCLQIWFPEDFDAYKVESDTLADTE